MSLIGVFKRRKEIHNWFYYFTRLFRGGGLRAYKIKPVLFLYAVGLLAATKTFHKRKEKRCSDNN